MKSTMRLRFLVASLVIAFCAGPAGAQGTTGIQTVPGMPPVVDPRNLYSETRSNNLSPAVANVPARVYVPHLQSNDVYVIDPATLKVIDRFEVGRNPQHVVPSWDLTTLWVTNNAEGRTDGTLTPIDPVTGKRGKELAVDDPYNMYFTPDGKSAVVVAEAMKRLDFRDPKTMALQASVSAPKCGPYQPRRLLGRRPVPDHDVRVRGPAREDRLDTPKSPRLSDATRPRHPSGRPRQPRRQALLRGGPARGGCAPDRRRRVQARRLHQDRCGDPRALPEPRRHETLCDQPWLLEDRRPAGRW